MEKTSGRQYPRNVAKRNSAGLTRPRPGGSSERRKLTFFLFFCPIFTREHETGEIWRRRPSRCYSVYGRLAVIRFVISLCTHAHMAEIKRHAARGRIGFHWISSPDVRNTIITTGSYVSTVFFFGNIIIVFILKYRRRQYCYGASVFRL